MNQQQTDIFKTRFLFEDFTAAHIDVFNTFTLEIYYGDFGEHLKY